MIKKRPAPTSPSPSSKMPSKADMELTHRLFGKTKLTIRGGALREIREDGQLVDIMGTPDIRLLAKQGFEPKVNGMVEYAFALSRPTDLPWRTIFLDLFERPQVVFSDSRIKVTCPPEDIAKVLARMVETANITNNRYAGIWEAVKQLAREQDERREIEEAKEAERNRLIQKSFDQLQMPLAPVVVEAPKDHSEIENPAPQSWAPPEDPENGAEPGDKTPLLSRIPGM